MEKCSNCGASIENGKCPYCGTEYNQQSTNDTAYAYNPAINIVINTTPANNFQQQQADTQTLCSKSKVTAFLLCLFLGYLGFHYFYVSKAGVGILYFLHADCLALDG